MGVYLCAMAREIEGDIEHTVTLQSQFADFIETSPPSHLPPSLPPSFVKTGTKSLKNRLAHHNITHRPLIRQ